MIVLLVVDNQTHYYNLIWATSTIPQKNDRMWLGHQKESIISFDYKNDVIIGLLVLRLGEVELQLEGSLHMRMQAATGLL